MTTYQLGSPNGWLGDTFQADDTEAAIAIAESAPYHETVLDVMDWQDGAGNPVMLLVVADS